MFEVPPFSRFLTFNCPSAANYLLLLCSAHFSPTFSSPPSPRDICLQMNGFLPYRLIVSRYNMLCDASVTLTEQN